MADPAIVINLATEFTGKKAFTTAEKATQKLGKSVKKLAGAFGLAFGTTAIIAFGKSAVRAAAEAEKANTRLLGVVKNIGLAFASTDITRFLDDISAASGIEGEKLAAAFQPLLTTTRSLTKSQELLRLSLDISAGTAEDLSTVTNDLGLAYVGNLKGLRKYNLGLTQAELKSKSFEKIVELLNKQFSGANAKFLDTYAGKMQVLGEASENAKEIIGKGIIDALMILGKNTSIDDLAADMTQAATDTAKLLEQIAKLKNAIFEPLDIGTSFLVKFINATQKYVDLLVAGDPSGFFKTPRTTAGRRFTGAQDSTTVGKLAASERAAAAALAKRIAAEKAAEAKIARDKKANEALKKAAANFDLNRINIAAALKATYDKDTTLRLLAMQAIENDQGELALKYLEQLGVLQKSVQTDKLKGITTIGNASLASLADQLLAELAAINKTEMSEDNKNKAKSEAFAKFNDAITKQGGLAAANSYAEATQDKLVSIAKLAALQNYGAALATLNTIMTSNEKAIALTQSANDLARYTALAEYIKLLGVAYNAAIALAQASAGKAVPGGIVIPGTGGAVVPGAGPSGNPFVPNPIFPGAGSSKDEKDARDDVIAAIIAAVVPHAAIAAAASEDAANAIAAIANNTDPTMIDYAAIYAAMESTARDDRGRSGDNITVNISAGVIADPDAFVAIVQDAIQVNNRRGNNLEVAGII